MPPKRKDVEPHRPPGHLDFRATEDDAWYNVWVHVDERRGEGGGGGGGGGRKGKEAKEEAFMRVMYCNFSDWCDESFRSGGFKDSRDLEEFRSRFRLSSEQMQDGDCGKVIEGMTVCVSSVFGENDVRFYDAVIDEVCFSKHKFIDGSEECTCTYEVLWQHGPNAGTRTITGIENICLLQSRSAMIDAELNFFLELSKTKLESVNHNLGKVAAFPTETEDLMVENFSKKNDVELQDMKNPRCVHITNQTVKVESRNLKRKLGQDTDLGGDWSLKNHAYPKDNYYLIWIENLENDLLPQIVIDFIYEQTSILSRVHVSPSFPSESYTRGVIFLDTKEKAEKLFGFLHSPAHIILSSSGRPWVVTQKEIIYESARGLISRSENQLCNKHEEHHNIIKVVHRGTKEYVKGKQMHALFMEFRDHLQHLHERLTQKERKLMQS